MDAGKDSAPSWGVPQEEVEECHCFYCLEGWVFLGSLDHDGEEVYEAICCRRCGGTGRING
jgi:hypothetical protein